MIWVIGMSESIELSRNSLPWLDPRRGRSGAGTRCARVDPTSSDCSQLQSIMPLNANVWVSGAVQSKCGNAGGSECPIGEQDAASLHHRVGLLPDAGAHPAAFRLCRRLQALALDIEQPAVKGAAQAAGFQPAECQVGSTVRAGTLDQPVPTLVVTKQHETSRPAGGPASPERLRPARRPVRPAANSSASACQRGAGSRAGDEVVLLCAQHVEIP